MNNWIPWPSREGTENKSPYVRPRSTWYLHTCAQPTPSPFLMTTARPYGHLTWYNYVCTTKDAPTLSLREDLRSLGIYALLGVLHLKYIRQSSQFTKSLHKLLIFLNFGLLLLQVGEAVSLSGGDKWPEAPKMSTLHNFRFFISLPESLFPLTRSQKAFSLKGQRVDILCLVGHYGHCINCSALFFTIKDST
jgi:hypothetical protein